jgi:hypothetical protein
MVLVIESGREASRRIHKDLQIVTVFTEFPVDFHKAVRLKSVALVAVISGVTMQGVRESSLLPGGEFLIGMTPEAREFSQGLIPAHYSRLGLLNIFPLRLRRTGKRDDQNTDAQKPPHL